MLSELGKGRGCSNESLSAQECEEREREVGRRGGREGEGYEGRGG